MVLPHDSAPTAQTSMAWAGREKAALGPFHACTALLVPPLRSARGSYCQRTAHPRVAYTRRCTGALRVLAPLPAGLPESPPLAPPTALHLFRTEPFCAGRPRLAAYAAMATLRLAV